MTLDFIRSNRHIYAICRHMLPVMPIDDTDLQKYSVYMCLKCGKIFRSKAKVPRCPIEICRSVKTVLTSEVPKNIYRFEEVSKLKLELDVLEDQSEQHLKALYRRIAIADAKIISLESRIPA